MTLEMALAAKNKAEGRLADELAARQKAEEQLAKEISAREILKTRLAAVDLERQEAERQLSEEVKKRTTAEELLTQEKAIRKGSVEKLPKQTAQTPTGKHTGLVGIGIASVEGRMVINLLTLASPAEAKGIRLGSKLLGVGTSRTSIIETAGKTEEQVLNLLRGNAGETVWLRYQSGNATDPVEVEITRRERFDEAKSLSLSWRQTGYELVLPREIVEQFPGCPRRYAYLDNQSKLLAFPDQHVGERIAVVTELLFPSVDSKQLELRMFNEIDSPVGLVKRLETPKFFKRVVNNNPAKNKCVIMHLRLRTYHDSPKLYGEVEEIMFLNDEAPDRYQPLILDLIQDGSKLPGERQEIAKKLPAGDKDKVDKLPHVPGYDFNAAADETLTVKATKQAPGGTYYEAEFTNKKGDSRRYLIETFETGKPFSIEFFRNGQPVESKAWWSNGKQSLSASFRNFSPSGTWEFWNNRGEVIGKIEFGANRPNVLTWDKEQMTMFAKTNNFYADVVTAAVGALRN
jgi:hypothetical protein